MRLVSKSIVALDIRDKYVRCVQIRHSSGKWKVQKSSLKEIPPSEDNENSSHQIQTAHVIKSLLQEMDIYPPKNVVVSISGKDAAIRLLNLPPLGDRKAKEVEEMIRYELMMHLPVNIEQMGYDYQIVESSDMGTKILTAGAKRSVLNRLLKLLSLAGVYPDVITTSSFALFNAFAQKEEIGNGKVGLVCLREPDGDAVVCEDGNLTYARSFAFQAAGEKEQVIRELHNSFDTYSRSRTSDAEQGERISVPVIHLVTEGDSNLHLTEDDLSHIAPGAQWKRHEAEDDLAFGLALAGSRSRAKPAPLSPLRVNLLKQVIREKRTAERKAVWARAGRMAPAIAIIVLLAISGMLWHQVYRAGGKLQLLEDTRQANRQRGEQVSKLIKTEEELQKQAKYLDWAAEGYPMVSYRLYEIALAIPDSLWLKEVKIPEWQPSRKRRDQLQPISKLYVIGYANEQRQIEEFLSNLRKCDCFSDVKQESTSETRLATEKILEFEIGLTSEPIRDSSASISYASNKGT